jgi:hypothetical protein
VRKARRAEVASQLIREYLYSIYVLVQNPHTGLAVGNQRLPIALANLGKEMKQIAARTEHA